MPWIYYTQYLQQLDRMVTLWQLEFFKAATTGFQAGSASKN